MVSPLLLAEVALCGVSLGTLMALTVGVWRSAARRPAAILLAFMAAGISAHMFEGVAPHTGHDNPLLWPLHLLSAAAGGLIWLFIGVVFEDARISPASLAPAAILAIVGLAGHLAPEGIAQAATWLVYNAAVIALAVHALWIVHRSGRTDLVEPRRRLRGPFFAMVTTYIVALSCVEAAEAFGVNVDSLHSVDVLVVTALCIAGTAIFLHADADLLAPARTPAPLFAPPGALAAPSDSDTTGEPANAADRVEILRLLAHMDEKRAWADETFSLDALSAAMGIPEHRLRRLINVQLGHRNFAHFVNGYRIAEARRILANPEQARRTVSSIAFDLGFGSLGPFNRAFKDETGQTPTQFRAAALGSGLATPSTGSPKPETSG